MTLSRFSRIALTLFAATIICASAWSQDVATAPAPAAAAGPKKRVAVMNFDYGTVKTTVAQIFGSDQDVGKGISDLLVQKLVQDGKYSVIERNALDKILAEQNFSNSDRADSATAAKIGKILGVDCHHHRLDHAVWPRRSAHQCRRRRLWPGQIRAWRRGHQ